MKNFFVLLAVAMLSSFSAGQAARVPARVFELPCPAGSTDMQTPTLNPLTGSFRSWLCVDSHGVVTSPVFGGASASFATLLGGISNGQTFRLGTSVFDLSGGNVLAALRLPTAPGAAPTVAGVFSFDSSALQPVFGDGTTTRKIPGVIGSPVNGDCSAFVVSGSSVGVTDAGACGGAAVPLAPATWAPLASVPGGGYAGPWFVATGDPIVFSIGAMGGSHGMASDGAGGMRFYASGGSQFAATGAPVTTIGAAPVVFSASVIPTDDGIGAGSLFNIGIGTPNDSPWAGGCTPGFNYAGFVFTKIANAAYGDWFVWSCPTGASALTVDTGVQVVKDTSYLLGMTINAAGTSIAFTINGVNVATSSTVPSGDLGLNFYFQGTSGGGTGELDFQTPGASLTYASGPPAGMYRPQRVSLASDRSLSANTAATVLTQVVTFPALAGVYRADIRYSAWATAGANACAAEVVDSAGGTFAVSGQNSNGAGDLALTGSEIPARWYAAGSTVTFSLVAICNANATLSTNSALFSGSLSELTFLEVTPVASN